MSKDPAVLLYIQDFLVGTSLLTPLQKGHYITLLCYQQQSVTGSLSEESIKLLMGKDYARQWAAIQSKFKSDDNGFFNERMRNEIVKRKRYSEKQSDRVKSRWKYHGNTTVDTMVIQHIGNTFLENEDENENKERGLGGKPNWPVKPGSDQLDLDLPKVKAGAIIELFKIAKNMNVSIDQVESLWRIFKSQNFNGEKFYQSANDAISHFFNWCKSQTVASIPPETSSPNGLNVREQKAKDFLKNM